MISVATGGEFRPAGSVAGWRSLENNTFVRCRVRIGVQFTYIHKPVYGSSAFA